MRGTSCALCHPGGAHSAPLRLPSACSDEIHAEGCTGRLPSFGLHGRSDPIWIKVSHLRSNSSDRLGQTRPAPHCKKSKIDWKPVGLAPFPQTVRKWFQLIWKSMDRLSSRGYGLWISRSHLNLSFTAACSASSSLVPIPLGFEKWLIIHLSGK